MITVVSFATALLIASSNGFLMEKRDVFSPFDSKDTPSTFTKNDLKDAILVAELKSKLSSSSAAPSNSLSPYSDVSVASANFIQTPNKPNDIKLAGKSNKEDPYGSLYYYYYPSKSENRDNLVDSPSYSLHNVEASSYNGGYGFFDMDADHTRYLIKVAIPLFVIGGVLLALSSISAITARSLDQPDSLVSTIEEEMGKVFDDYFSVLKSEECLNRIICEAGYVSANYPITGRLLSALEAVVPNAMKGKVDVFKSTALRKKNAKKCHLYECHISKRSKAKKTS